MRGLVAASKYSVVAAVLLTLSAMSGATWAQAQQIGVPAGAGLGVEQGLIDPTATVGVQWTPIINQKLPGNASIACTVRVMRIVFFNGGANGFIDLPGNISSEPLVADIFEITSPLGVTFPNVPSSVSLNLEVDCGKVHTVVTIFPVTVVPAPPTPTPTATPQPA